MLHKTELQAGGNVMEHLDHELHDLAQPVTALQCRLEVGLLEGAETSLEDAVRGALDDVHRIAAAVLRMRQLVSHASKAKLVRGAQAS